MHQEMDMRNSSTNHRMLTDENCHSVSLSHETPPTDSPSINQMNGLSRSMIRQRPSRSEGCGPATQKILFSILSGKHDTCRESPSESTDVSHEADDLVDLSGRVGFSNGVSDFLTPNDYRQRSQSMGSNFGFGGYTGAAGAMTSDLSRTSSHDSLASFDSETSIGRLPHSQSDAQLEATRSRLKHLLMGGGESLGPTLEEGGGSLSHPGTPPSSNSNYSMSARKYSEGSQKSHLKAKLMGSRLGGAWGQRQAGEDRRRKPYSRPEPAPTNAHCEEIDQGMDEGYDEAGSSLLKMMLTRGRSNSLSVFESFRPRSNTLGAPRRQYVTLAKKNLLPIAARVSDRLNKVVEFATSLPEFLRMSLTDQMTLLVGACPRLLLLYMAEMNLQFAVTPMHEDPTSASSPATGTMPTIQFVEAVQTFIRKCQTMNVTANEYFYMRMIALFRTGPGGTLDGCESAERVHSEARQDLQELVQHSHPDQKLRYITLLLTLHTLFSVNCGMLQALFCDPILVPRGTGLEVFIRKRLEDSTAVAAAGSSEEQQPVAAAAAEPSSTAAAAVPSVSALGLASVVTTIGLTNVLLAPTTTGSSWSAVGTS